MPLIFVYIHIINQPRNLENSDQVILTPINFDKAELIVTNFSLPIIVNDWWEMNNNVVLFYKRVESSFFSNPETLSTNAGSFNSNQRFKMGKKLSAEVSGSYNSGFLNGLTRMKSVYQISIGLRKQFGDNGGTLSMNLSDVFRTLMIRTESIVNENNLIYTSTREYDSRVLRISYSKNLGNRKLKSRSNRKGGSVEDLQRISN